MYKKIKSIVALMCITASISVQAQVTTSSPYSKFGVGNIKGSLLPQFRAMGGISTAINKPNGFNNINIQNPASYSSIFLMTADIGISAGITDLSRNTISEKSFNSTLSHLSIGIPVTKKSALSFGILPYSDLGYNFKSSTKIDTTQFDYLYTGEGGLSKAYLGYGYQIGEHFRIGANMEYLFGNLKETRSTELPNSPGSIFSRMQNKNSVGGISFSYGAQYDINLSAKTKMTLGYSGSSASTISSRKSFVVTQYLKDASGNEAPALDTLINQDNAKANLKMPLIHNFGIAIQKNNKWLIGADFRVGNWSKLTIDNENQGLQDSYGFSVGGQITPDITSVTSYLKTVDYRFGINYDKTYIRLSNQDIKQMGISAGLGFPLPSANRSAFYKINFTTELGQRGTITNNLVKENYVNFHLGFTLNDTWFRKYKFD